MQFRELAERDLAACAATFVAAFAAEPWNEHWEPEAVEARLREVLGTPDAFGLTAHDDGDGRLAAFVVGYAERRGPTRHFYVKEMCVRPDRQRHGVGSASWPRCAIASRNGASPRSTC